MSHSFRILLGIKASKMDLKATFLLVSGALLLFVTLASSGSMPISDQKYWDSASNKNLSWVNKTANGKIFQLTIFYGGLLLWLHILNNNWCVSFSTSGPSKAILIMWWRR